jgi:hypothetical protein
MPIDLPDMMALAQACAPTVATSTLLAVAQAESGFEPLAIGVGGRRPVHHGSSKISRIRTPLAAASHDRLCTKAPARRSSGLPLSTLRQNVAPELRQSAPGLSAGCFHCASTTKFNRQCPEQQNPPSH